VFWIDRVNRGEILPPFQGVEEWLERIRPFLPNDQEAYLVGGAVRDLLLKRPLHDLDLVLSGDVRQVAKRVANALNAAFYMLDDARDTARVIARRDGEPFVIDFAAYRAQDLEGDLRERDFTINAMALRLTGEQALIDPLGGWQDVRSATLRACSAASFEQDPLRILRAARLSVQLGFKIERGTYHQMRVAAAQVTRVAGERKRDELFRIFENPRPAAAIRILDSCGALDHIFPELSPLKGTEQSPPHSLDVWEHTLVVLQELESLMAVLVGAYREETANLMYALAVLRLGRFREQLEQHTRQYLSSDRPVRALLFLGVLFHDAGKPATGQVDQNERIRFFGHEKVSAELVGAAARRLALSQVETQRLQAITAHHMRVHHLADNPEAPTRRAVYRYFKATGEAGVDICLLTLADVLATYRMNMTQERWLAELDVCRALLEYWWEAAANHTRSPRLLTGADLQEQLRLKPGRLIGELLEAVEEAAAIGEIASHAEALNFAREWLQEHYPAVLEGGERGRSTG
jgi:tRNA nucleotidyltransferase/poly(A) polymerase